MMFKRQNRIDRQQRERLRDEYRRRVALGEPPLRAANVLPMYPRDNVVPIRPEPERTLVLIEGGAQGKPKRRAIWVYGSGVRN